MLRRFLGFFSPSQRTLRLWNARDADRRTSTFLHDFEAETWALGLRLGPDVFKHHLAVMLLLRDVIEPAPH